MSNFIMYVHNHKAEISTIVCGHCAVVKIIFPPRIFTHIVYVANCNVCFSSSSVIQTMVYTSVV